MTMPSRQTLVRTMGLWVLSSMQGWIWSELTYLLWSVTGRIPVREGHVKDASMFKTLQDAPADVTVACSLGSSLPIFLQSAGLLASKKDLYITVSGNLLNSSWFPLLGGIDAGVPTAQCPVPSTFIAVTLPNFCSCLLLLQCRKHPQT